MISHRQFSLTSGALVHIWLSAVVLLVSACATEPGDDPDPPSSRCGDATCNGSETELTCPTDCDKSTCGDLVCDATETEASCPADCKKKSVCGDMTCAADETPTGCPQDCTGEMTFQNDSSLYINHIYVHGCSAPEGEDRLKSGYVYPGSRFTVGGLPGGCYLFRVTSTGGTTWRPPTGYNLKNGENATWRLYY